MVGNPGQIDEKEGGTVEGSSKPVDDRIKDPKSKSINENNLLFVWLGHKIQNPKFY